MRQRIVLGLIVAAAAVIGIAYASAFLPGGAPAWAAWLLAFGTTTILIATIALGALQRGTARTFVNIAALFVTYIILAGGFALALSLDDGDPANTLLWLGLPRRAAIVIYGIGLLPILTLPLAYALTFERATLTPEDWQRVRDAARQLRTSDPSGTPEQPRA